MCKLFRPDKQQRLALSSMDDVMFVHSSQDRQRGKAYTQNDSTGGSKADAQPQTDPPVGSTRLKMECISTIALSLAVAVAGDGANSAVTRRFRSRRKPRAQKISRVAEFACPQKSMPVLLSV